MKIWENTGCPRSPLAKKQFSMFGACFNVTNLFCVINDLGMFESLIQVMICTTCISLQHVSFDWKENSMKLDYSMFLRNISACAYC